MWYLTCFFALYTTCMLVKHCHHWVDVEQCQGEEHDTHYSASSTPSHHYTDLISGFFFLHCFLNSHSTIVTMVFISTFTSIQNERKHDLRGYYTKIHLCHFWLCIFWIMHKKLSTYNYILQASYLLYIFTKLWAVQL